MPSLVLHADMKVVSIAEKFKRKSVGESRCIL